MHKLKTKHGVESAFKIAWSAYKKHGGDSKKAEDHAKHELDKIAKADVANGGMGEMAAPSVPGIGGMSMAEGIACQKCGAPMGAAIANAITSGLCNNCSLAKNLGDPAAYGPGGSAMPKSEMSKAEMCKSCGYEHAEGKHYSSDDDDKLDKFAKGEMPAGSAPESPGPKPGVTPDDKKPKMQAAKSQEGGNDGTDIKKAGMQPGGGAPPAMGAGPAGPKPPKAGAGTVPGPKLPKLPKPGAAAAPKPPAMGAGQPALKNELQKDLTWSPASKGSSPASPWSEPPPVPAKARLGLGDPNASLRPGQSVSMKPIASNPTKPGAPGHVVDNPAPQQQWGAGKPVQTMAARVASRMPAGQPGAALTPPPAHGRPGVALPGAHLFQKPTTKPPAK